MNKKLITLLCAALPLSLVAQITLPADASAQKRATLSGQDYIESMSYNAHKRGSERVLQYYPDGEDFVCINGNNRYTRALYGSITPFRLETSDRPVFAAYDKSKSKNISFRIKMPDGRRLPLDMTEFCETRYTPGRRSYRLTDSSWGKGELRISALALPDADGAVWRIESKDMPSGAELIGVLTEIRAKRLNRNGDMGADPADSFESPVDPQHKQECAMELKGKDFYLVCLDYALQVPAAREGKAIYEKAEKARQSLVSQVKIDTPDPYFNTLGGALAAAADGIWSGEVWLHGAVGWRMPLSGWRAAYTGDALGWHDRARKHFDAYAASQVTEVEPVIPHPAQDREMNLARAEKRWGTQMYSNGYICRNPRENNKMHHYDMNLCYIDELLWHLNWTGDLDYARRMWPLLVRHLAWEKRNFDPDADGLYDAYACIWASDALQYNSGAVTHSSAYNYRANRMAAEIAGKIGENPEPYRLEAERILAALNSRLWLKDKGHWAEFQDFMGHRKLHESAALWTVYHAIDSDVHDPFQGYQATRYVDTEIPHIPVAAKGLTDEGYATVSTTNWFPYSWSINNVAFAEVMHTALAYWQAGRNEEGFKLFKSSVLDGMYVGSSPGNFGQISFYDAARGECYRDFGDPVGVASRALVQGLFGILPDAMNGKLLIRPGFPSDWDRASISTSDVDFSYNRRGAVETYKVKMNFPKQLALTLQLRAYNDRISSVKVNGKPADWRIVESASGYPVIAVETPVAKEVEVKIEWKGTPFNHMFAEQELIVKQGSNWNLPLTGLNVQKIYDPQGVFDRTTVTSGNLTGRVKGAEGHRTFFLLLKQGDMEWWQPVNIEVKGEPVLYVPQFETVDSSSCEPVVMDSLWNESVARIFKNEYLSPRSPYTTLQVPKQGIGEWCHPKTTAMIDDSGVRSQSGNGVFVTKLGVPFRTPEEGKNIAFTSLWDNYPDSIQLPLSGKARRAYLLMAGTTNHMQCHFVNGVVKVEYADGTSDVLNLVNPDNWCPIEQDYFVDGKAFRLNTLPPYRLHLKTGLVSRTLGKDLAIEGVYGRSIDGGAGVLLDMPLNPDKTLKAIKIETIANEVIIGLMGITLQR